MKNEVTQYKTRNDTWWGYVETPTHIIFVPHAGEPLLMPKLEGKFLRLMRDALRAAARHARQDPDAYPEGGAELIHQANDAYTEFVDARTGRLR